jgi:hypothetical protein
MNRSFKKEGAIDYYMDAFWFDKWGGYRDFTNNIGPMAPQMVR